MVIPYAHMKTEIHCPHCGHNVRVCVALMGLIKSIPHLKLQPPKPIEYKVGDYVNEWARYIDGMFTCKECEQSVSIRIMLDASGHISGGGELMRDFEFGQDDFIPNSTSSI